MYVAVGNIADVAGARVRLYPRGIGAVDGCDVFEDDVVDVIGGGGRVTERANAHGAGFVAGYIFNEDVAAVAFDGYAVLRIISFQYSS